MAEVEPAFRGPAFLGVERSLGGRRWIDRGGDDRLGLALAQRFALPDLVGRLLAGRGVTLESAEEFLTPTLRRALPNPSEFLDMDKAAEILAEQVLQGATLGLFGDYDVDGATSAALLYRFFSALGPPPLIHIPDRMREGYGPNLPALLSLKERGAQLVITVDCGATAQDPLRAAAAAGVKVIVCDHHVGEPALPPALAIVNPNRFDETTGHRALAAVGVAFLLAVAVNRQLRQAGFYARPGRSEPDLFALLDLVALGTVADVVPLTGLNRAFVTQGLAILRQRRAPGLRALADHAGLNEPLEAYHLGFVFGPRVNAGGRVGEAALGARLLTTDDPAEAQSIAQKLHHYNEERRAIETQVQEEAIAKIERTPSTKDPAFFLVAGEGWHAGVIGIVASRLKDRYHRPVCVVALAEGIGKGSGRSLPGIDLGAAVIAARQAGLLTAGGGHAMAAGFTVEEARLGALEAFFLERIEEDRVRAPRIPQLAIDAGLDCRGATPELLAEVARLAPFGEGNSEPRFVITPARCIKADVVGGGACPSDSKRPPRRATESHCLSRRGHPDGRCAARSSGRLLSPRRPPSPERLARPECGSDDRRRRRSRLKPWGLDMTDRRYADLERAYAGTLDYFDGQFAGSRSPITPLEVYQRMTRNPSWLIRSLFKTRDLPVRPFDLHAIRPARGSPGCAC